MSLVLGWNNILVQPDRRKALTTGRLSLQFLDRSNLLCELKHLLDGHRSPWNSQFSEIIVMQPKLRHSASCPFKRLPRNQRSLVYQPGHWDICRASSLIHCALLYKSQKVLLRKYSKQLLLHLNSSRTRKPLTNFVTDSRCGIQQEVRMVTINRGAVPMGKPQAGMALER